MADTPPTSGDFFGAVSDLQKALLLSEDIRAIHVQHPAWGEDEIRNYIHQSDAYKSGVLTDGIITLAFQIIRGKPYSGSAPSSAARVGKIVAVAVGVGVAIDIGRRIWKKRKRS